MQVREEDLYDLEGKLAGLEKRVARLEFRESRVIDWLYRVGPGPGMAVFILEHGLDCKEQVQGILDVLNNTHEILEAGGPCDDVHFARQLMPFLPSEHQNRDSVKCLLGYLRGEGQFDLVVKHFEKAFNVR